MLKVWIPGTTDTRDQGLGGTTWANSGVTINSSGKLGKCLYSGSGNMTTSNFSLSTKWSYSCWWKDSNTSAGWQYIFLLHNGTQNDWNSQMAFLSYPTQSRCEVCSNGKWYSTQAYTSGTWNHIAATYDGTTCKVYFNGIYTTSFTPGQTVTGTNLQIFKSANVYLNDLRIWDNEVISAKEIEIISRGLVLHYPLAMPGQENLLLNTATPVSWITTYTNTDQWSTKDIYNMKSPVNQLFEANDTATFSFDWEFTPGSSGSIKGSFHLETGNVTPWILGSVSKSTGTRNNASNYIDLSATNTSGHVTCTFIVSSSAASAADTFRYFRIRWDKTPKDGTLKLSNCKLERGEIATPWVPNPADTAYTALGFNDGIEYDVSGFQYNGEKYGDLKWSNNSAKYNSCYEFDGSSDYIRLKQDLYSQFRLARDEVTVNIWAYKDDWDDYKNSGSTAQWMTMCGCQEGGGFSIYEVGNGRFAFVCGTGASSNSYRTSNTSTGYADSLSSGWHMFTLTFDGLSLKGYVDGNLIVSNAFFTTKTPIYYNTGTTSIYIGVESGSGKQAGLWWKGKLSDFRVYTTALSAEDILELYHTPITLANNGTLLTQGEFVES